MLHFVVTFEVVIQICGVKRMHWLANTCASSIKELVQRHSTLYLSLIRSCCTAQFETTWLAKICSQFSYGNVDVRLWKSSRICAIFTVTDVSIQNGPCLQYKMERGVGENNLDDKFFLVFFIYFYVMYVSLECSRIYGRENDLEGFTYCKRERNTTL